MQLVQVCSGMFFLWVPLCRFPWGAATTGCPNAVYFHLVPGHQLCASSHSCCHGNTRQCGGGGTEPCATHTHPEQCHYCHLDYKPFGTDQSDCPITVTCLSHPSASPSRCGFTLHTSTENVVKECSSSPTQCPTQRGWEAYIQC